MVTDTGVLCNPCPATAELGHVRQTTAADILCFGWRSFYHTFLLLKATANITAAERNEAKCTAAATVVVWIKRKRWKLLPNLREMGNTAMETSYERSSHL